jgi:hypothetical protein
VASRLNDVALCQVALMDLLLVRKHLWSTCVKAVKSGSVPVHGSCGKVSNKYETFIEKVEPALKSFFDDTLLKLAGARPTRFVRNHVTTANGNMEVRRNEVRDNNDILELDPEWTKRQCFSMYCWDQGHKLKLDSRVRQTLEKRDDAIWENGDQEFKRVCSWSRFLKYWGTSHPNLHVRRPRADICALRYQFHIGNILGKGTNYCGMKS